MQKESILHIPMSQYAHGINPTRLVIRLRAAKNDLKKCTLYYGDTACRKTPIDFFPISMKIVASDLYFDYYEADFESPYHRLYYYFELYDGKEKLLYYSDFFRNNRVDDRSEYYKIPFNHKADIASIPEWAEDAVIYNIFPDSFATSHRYISKKSNEKSFGHTLTRGKLGGTIKGITENIDYLQELGVTCIYINPIFAAGEYHKYDTIDYFKVDPCFGSNEDFKELVEQLHQNNMRIMIDGVFNHCGWEFFAFEDVVLKGENSIYKDWFYRLQFPVRKPQTADEIPDYECFGYERLMPKLDTSNQEVMEYLLKVAIYWVKEFDIDGWRLDVASEVNDGFWREFRKAVKMVKEDCFIIGEVWESAGHWLLGDQFDSSMNYDMRKHAYYFFAEQSIDAEMFDACVTNMRMRYKKNMLAGQLNLLDSHDVSRFFSLAKGNVDAWKLAILFQFCFLGIPCMFYGDEQMLSGNKEEEYRQPMQWQDRTEMFYFYQKIIAIRKENIALQSGEYKTVSAKSGSRVYAFKRFTQDSEIVIILNTSENTIENPVDTKDYKTLWKTNMENTKIGKYGFCILKSSCNEQRHPL